MMTNKQAAGGSRLILFQGSNLQLQFLESSQDSVGMQMQGKPEFG